MLEIRPLRPEDRRTEFSSGNLDLDRFFQKYAGQNQFRLHLGTTYVAVESERILGYVSLAACSITVDQLAKKQRKRLPKYPLPALRIARLAVAQDAQGGGVGSHLLRTAFSIAIDMSEKVGCVGIVVDAKQDAIAFYEKLGFEQFEVLVGQMDDRPSPTLMFLPMGSITPLRPERNG